MLYIYNILILELVIAVGDVAVFWEANFGLCMASIY